MNTLHRLFILLLTALSLRSAAAQGYSPLTALPNSVPAGVNYQGRLEENGFPVHGDKTMVFKVFDAVSGGTELWNSGNTTVSVDRGLFNTVLSISTTALSGGGARFLDVTVEGTALAPREPLNAVPYALVAKTVEGTLDITAGGLSVSSSPTAGSALSVSSTNARVGIGTLTPARNLEISGPGTVIQRLTSTSGNVALEISPTTGFGDVLAATSDGSDSKTLRLSGGGDVTTTRGAVLELPGNEAATNAGDVILRAGDGGNTIHLLNGNVGIGTTTASVTLEVNGDAAFGSGGARSTFTSTGDLQMIRGSTITTAGTLTISTAASASLTGTPAVFVSTNGNVGLGTAAPTTKLHIVGGNVSIGTHGHAIDPADLSASENLLVSGNVIVDGVFISHNASGSSATFTANGDFIVGTSTLVVTNGRVGIGTPSPTEILHVAPGTDASGQIRLGAGGGAPSANRDVSVVLDAPSSGGFPGSSLVRFRRDTSELWQLGLDQTPVLNAKNAVTDFYINDGSGYRFALHQGGGATFDGGAVEFGSGATRSTFSATGNLQLVSGSTLTTNGTLSISTSPSAVTTSTPTLFIDRDGEVGLGTRSPGTRLEVSGPYVSTKGQFYVNTDDHAIISLESSGDPATKQVGFFVRRSGEYKWELYNPGNSNDFRFAGGAGLADVFTLQPGGRAGLGTTAPTAQLHISSSNATTADTLLQVSSGTAAGQQLFVVQGDAKVGIGTSAPASRLHLQGGDVIIGDSSIVHDATAAEDLFVAGNIILDGTLIQHGGSSNVFGDLSVGAAATRSTITSSGNLQLVRGSTITSDGTLTLSTAPSASLATPALFINPSGQVGIGNASPSSALSVGGTASLSGNIVSSGTGVNIFAGGVAIGTPTVNREVLGTSASYLNVGNASGASGSGRILLTGSGSDYGFISGWSAEHSGPDKRTSEIGFSRDGATVGSGVIFVRTAPNDSTTPAEALRIDGSGNTGLGLAATRSTVTSTGQLQLVSGSTITSNGTLSISTGPSAALTGIPTLFIDRQGNLGVGTASPGQKLHVVDTGAFNLRVENTATTPNFSTFDSRTGADGNTIGSWDFFAKDSAGNTQLYGQVQSISDNVTNGSELSSLRFNNQVAGVATEIARIKGTSFGIGTTSPGARLEVSTGAIGANAVDSVILSRGDATVGGGTLLRSLSATRFGGVNDAASTESFQVRDTADAVKFYIGTTGDFNGRIGIGTTKPGSSIHMSSGTVIIDGNVTNSLLATGRVGLGTVAPTSTLQLETEGTNTDGGYLLVNSQNATIGAGLAMAGIKSARADSNQYNFLKIQNPTGVKMIIQGDGLVGIGTATATTLLDVNGNAQFGADSTKSTFTATGALQLGSSLSIGAGNAITKHLSATGAIDFAATAANACDAAVFPTAMTGAADGDVVTLGVPNALASTAHTTYYGFVSSADTITIKRCNVSTSAATDPALATIRVDVWKH